MSPKEANASVTLTGLPIMWELSAGTAPAGLYDLDVTTDLPESCRVAAWRPAVPGIREVFHASLVEYHYPMHYHDAWTVLIIDEGAVRYDIEKHQHGTVGDMVAILPPGVIHDGRTSHRYGLARKRNLYLDPEFLPAELAGAAVDGSSFRDRALRSAVAGLHDRLMTPDPLDVETRLAMIAERLRQHFGQRRSVVAEPEPELAERLRDFLDGDVTGRIRLADAAAALDRSVPHLVRSFTRRFGVSPYAYVIGARVDRARARLLDGADAGRVAAEVGFYDQAHFSRHFKRFVSVTPAHFARTVHKRHG
ncbi:MAG: helix-turn-helix domain-containing protein [Stackebrandtia sp.]